MSPAGPPRTPGGGSPPGAVKTTPGTKVVGRRAPVGAVKTTPGARAVSRGTAQRSANASPGIDELIRQVLEAPQPASARAQPPPLPEKPLRSAATPRPPVSGEKRARRPRPAGPKTPAPTARAATTGKVAGVQREKPIALILAAGASRRMGSPKALLDLGGVTFLEACARVFARAGVAPLVVLGADADLISAVHHGLNQVRNHAWPNGQLSSVRTGLRAALAQGATSIFVHPVDAPRLHWSTVATLRDALRQGHRVAVPAHGEQLGHPLALTVWAAKQVLDSEAPNLWDAVVGLQPLRVKVRDTGAFENINNPAQYRRLLT